MSATASRGGKGGDGVIEGRPMEQTVVTDKQHRLLLLHHAAKCSFEDGECKIRSCGIMKQIWKHIAQCKSNSECDFPHCVASRSVLSHYRKCKDAFCLICAPVRDRERLYMNKDRKQVEQRETAPLYMNKERKKVEERETAPTTLKRSASEAGLSDTAKRCTDAPAENKKCKGV